MKLFATIETKSAVRSLTLNFRLTRTDKVPRVTHKPILTPVLDQHEAAYGRLPEVARREWAGPVLVGVMVVMLLLSVGMAIACSL